jgi:dTDP-4-dehydrorhamnose reductase
VRLLVAGAQGQLARAMIELAPSAADITAFALGRPALDLTAPASVLKTLADFKPDVIVNAAAYTAVDKAESEPDAAIALNADGPARLAEAADRMGAVLIHVSTDYVFDGTSASPYVETDATHPLNTYGESKLQGEKAVAAANPRHLILRTSWVYSPFGANFAPTILERAQRGGTIEVAADQTGSPTSALDLADAVLAAAATALGGAFSDWGIYHAAGTGEASRADQARRVLEISRALGGPDAVIRDVPTIPGARAPRPARSRLSSAKFAATFGWAFPHWRNSTTAVVKRLVAGDRQ